MDTDRTIYIDHDIEIKRDKRGRATASGGAEILKQLKDYRLIILVDVGLEDTLREVVCCL